MMSFALMGCLIFSASDAMAQGRSRSQGGSTSSRSQTAAVSRSNNSTAPTVSRSSSGSSMSRSSSVGSVSHDRSSATPQVSKSTSSVSRERSSAMPQVNRSTGNNSSSRSGSAVTRATGSSSSRTGMGNSTGNSTVTRRSDGSKMSGTGMGVGERTSATTTDKKTSRMTTGTSSMDKGRGGNGGGTKPIEGGNLSDRGGKPGNGGKPGGGNGNGSGMGKDNGGGKPGGGNGNGSGMGKDNGGKPDSGRGGNGRGGNGRGFGKDNHFDYSNHHYRHDFRDNFDRHNWSRPLPPPARPYRPAPIHWYRPVIPAGWYPYAGAPIIDRILGLTFGTFFDTSLDYLYYNGYEIDGYADNVIYLRNVMLLNRVWDDVMLCYDSANRLVNAQFIYHTAYYDTNRYNSVYRNLCRVYGQPITGNGRTVSWYGGNNTGWVTLSLNNNLGHYYTTISIGY